MQDDLDEEDDEIDFEDHTSIQSMLDNTDMHSKKTSPGKKSTLELDGVIDADGVIDVNQEADKVIDLGEVDEVIDAGEGEEVIDTDGVVDA